MTSDARVSDRSFSIKEASRVRQGSRAHINGKTDCSVTVSYFNRFDRPICITHRDGSVNVLQPISSNANDELIVCVSRLMSRDVMERTLDYLKIDTIDDDPERDQWIRAYEAALYNKTHLMLQASVEYVLHHRDLSDAGGRCYMPDLDILVEWQAERGHPHPFSKVQRSRATMEAIVPGVDEETFVLMIKAVDNSQYSQRADRYVNIGNKVFRIPVERDLNYQSGVHLVTRRPVNDDNGHDRIAHFQYNFEEADKVLSLHRTVEDAINGGPIEAVARSLVEKVTAEKKVEEAHMRAEQLDEEARLQRLRNEGAMYKAEQENAAWTRKNYVEWAKTISALFGAAITIYGLWSKITAK